MRSRKAQLFVELLHGRGVGPELHLTAEHDDSLLASR
jgi:hypothetical protein